MKPLKKILKSARFQECICWVAHKYIWFVYHTSRWEVQGKEVLAMLERKERPYLLAFWHGRLLMIPPFAAKELKIHVLISVHNDGQLIARTMEHFGFGLVRGSTNKSGGKQKNHDGSAAIRSVLKYLRKKEYVAITPDGPRGPRMRVSGTIADIARMTGTPVIPVTYSTTRCKILRSWDRFMLAMPFGRGVFMYGEPVDFRQDFSEEQMQAASRELENRLNTMTRQADEMLGLEPVEPE